MLPRNGLLQVGRILHQSNALFVRPPLLPGLTFALAMRSHSLFRRLVSLLLAVLVLTSTVGLTVQRHTCRISGRSKVEVSVPGQLALRGCVGQLAPATSVAKDNCCDFSSHLHKLSAPAHELAAKVLVPAPLLAVLVPEMTWPVAPAAVAQGTEGPRWFAADSSPPPRGGRTLLAFVCRLVV